MNTLKINPVHFLTVERHKRYIVNPQYLASSKSLVHTPMLKNRSECVLAAVTLKMNQIPGNSILEMKCVRPRHSARFCAGISSLRLSRSMFEHRLTSVGNLLVEIHSERCHACGESSTRCWREYTGHYVCGTCVIMGRGLAPYAYGETKNKCCLDNDCGNGMGLYSESGHVLFSKAISIYERYTQ